MPDIFNKVFGDALRPAPQPEPPPLVATEAHEKLRRNLGLALDRHHDLIAKPLTPETTAHDKRLALEASTSTIKAALATDRTALRTRQEDTLGIALIRIWLSGVLLGKTLEPGDLEKLRTMPRAKLQAALNPRQLAEYDLIDWSDPKNPKILPPPPKTPEEIAADAEIQRRMNEAFGRTG
jgi:hypothetical protein